MRNCVPFIVAIAMFDQYRPIDEGLVMWMMSRYPFQLAP